MRARATEFLKSLVALIGPCALVSGIVLAASFGTFSQQRTATVMLVNLVFVCGLYVFVGNSGVLSFGHASFMGIGAYTAALLTIPETQKNFLLPGLPDLLATAQTSELTATLVAISVAAVVALALAGPLMRLSGLPAGIATLAVLVIVYVVLSQSVTGETRTLVGVPLTTTMGSALIWALLAITAAFAFQRSSLALRLRASREDEVVARSVGVGVTWERTAAFVVSAAIVAVSGSLYAHLQGSITPDAFYFNVTFLTLAMLVVGGMSSLSGAVLGTVVVSAIAEALRQLEKGVTVGPIHLPARAGLTEVGLGILMLIILIVRPSGITGGREFRWPSRLTRRSRTGNTAAAAEVIPSSDGPTPP